MLVYRACYHHALTGGVLAEIFHQQSRRTQCLRMLGMKKTSHLWWMTPGDQRLQEENDARRNFRIAMMYIDFLYAASDGAVWGNKKRCKLMRCLTLIWCHSHQKSVFFSKNVFFNGNANKANIFKKWHEFVTGHKHFGWSEHIEKNKEDLHHHMHQPKHSSKQRPLRLKRCFLMVSAPKPLKQESFCNKSFRSHCKGNVFFQIWKISMVNKQTQEVLPPSTGETNPSVQSFFWGFVFDSRGRGRSIPQWKRQMAYPGARWEWCRWQGHMMRIEEWYRNICI